MSGMDFDLDFGMEDIDNHVKTADLEDDLVMGNEDLQNNQPIDEEEVYAVWGSASAIQACGEGRKSGGGETPSFALNKLRSGVYDLHLFRGHQPMGGAYIYQFLLSLTEDDVVEIHFHGTRWDETVLLQAAMKETKATTICSLYMLDASPVNACTFFVWMLGKVLRPIPHDIISMTEPVSVFSLCGGGKSYHNKNMEQCGITVRQNWYDDAVLKGLLTIDEIVKLNEGHDITITGINARIEALNSKSGLTA